MSMSATIEALRAEVAPSRAAVEARLRAVYGSPAQDITGLYEYSVALGGGWWFFLNALTDGSLRKKINRYVSWESPLVWAIRGRHPSMQDEDSVYYNTPEDVATINARIRGLPEEEVRAMFQREHHAAYDALLAEGIEPERVESLVGKREESPSTELWEEVAAFYRRAAAEERYVVCWIG